MALMIHATGKGNALPIVIKCAEKSRQQGRSTLLTFSGKTSV